MRSRRSHIKTKECEEREEREERKRRQEKFRKRSKSLFNKTRLLAKDTDAWVALVVRDRAGRVQSFRASATLYWPPSIHSLMTKHPSGTHEFLEKPATSSCWKEVAGDESDAGQVDGESELIDEAWVEASTIHVEKEGGQDSNVFFDRQAEDVNAPNETVDEQSAVDPLEESDIALCQLKDLDETVVDAEKLLCVTLNPAREPENARVEALDSGKPDDTIFEFGEPPKTIEAVDNTTAHKPRDSAAEPDPIASEYDMMDVDIPGAKGDPKEAPTTLYTMSYHHNPPSSGGLGSGQVVKRPQMDPMTLLRSWSWVFQNKNPQSAL